METRWHTLFKDATYAGLVNGGPVRELVSTGDLAPQDLAAHEVRHYLRQDAILRSVFGERMDVMPWLSPADARTFPRLAVYTTSNLNSERPTATSVEMASIYVGTMWDTQSADPVQDGRATVATVLSHIKRVLRAEKARALVVWLGSQRAMAHDVSIGGERYDVLRDLEGRANGIVHEIEFQYRLHVDRGGQLVNLL